MRISYSHREKLSQQQSDSIGVRPPSKSVSFQHFLSELPELVEKERAKSAERRRRDQHYSDLRAIVAAVMNYLAIRRRQHQRQSSNGRNKLSEGCHSELSE
ncbi:hypothetical protein VTP01DRAFT_1740, partial [Rhizomucor pusillus]|uniref:uncharacterized protein n=1 Tax=Rhizomucor pusillus TaxID=4840 RepID=UPI003742D953